MSLNVSKLVVVSLVFAAIATAILSFVFGSALPEGASFSVLQYSVMMALFAAVGILPGLMSVSRDPLPATAGQPVQPQGSAARDAASRAGMHRTAARAPVEKKSDPAPASSASNSAYAHIPVETGTVKWFNSNKGFGFISRENGEDVFVHFRSVQGRNRYLKPGQAVEFKVVQGDKGVQAEEVSMID